MKKSKLDTPFFAHKAKTACTTTPETESHLRLKQMAEAARARAWDAATEVAGAMSSGEPCKADVLARKGPHKLAVEIQWSPQTNDETLRRRDNVPTLHYLN